MPVQLPYFQENKSPRNGNSPVLSPEDQAKTPLESRLSESKKKKGEVEISQEESSFINESLKILSDKLAEKEINSSQLIETMSALIEAFKNNESSSTVDATIKYILESSGETSPSVDSKDLIEQIKERLDNIERKISGKPDLPPKQ